MREKISRRELIRTGSAAALATVTVGTVNAEEEITGSELVGYLEDSENPEKEFQKLSSTEQKKVLRYLRPEKTTVKINEPDPESAISAASGCKEVTAEFTGVNGSGSELYTYNMEVNWCYDGSTVSSTDRRRWGNTSAVFWEYVGHQDSNERGGDGDTFYESTSTGHFRLCVSGNMACAQHVYPSVEVSVYSDGTYTTDSDG